MTIAYKFTFHVLLCPLPIDYWNLIYTIPYKGQTMKSNFVSTCGAYTTATPSPFSPTRDVPCKEKWDFWGRGWEELTGVGGGGVVDGRM